MGDRKFVTVNIASVELGVTQRHIYNLLRAGWLEAVDISIQGRKGSQSLRISVASIQDFLQRRRVDPDNYYAADFEEE